MSCINKTVEYGDFNHICRLCLRKSMNSTFKDLTGSKQFGFIEEVLKTHINFKIEDDKPQNVCRDCKLLLFKTCRFLEMCILSNNILDEALKQKNVTTVETIDHRKFDCDKVLKQENTDSETANHGNGDLLETKTLHCGRDDILKVLKQRSIKVETEIHGKDDLLEFINNGYIFQLEVANSREDDSDDNHLSEENTLVEVEDNEIIIIKDESSVTELNDEVGIGLENVTKHPNTYAYPFVCVDGVPVKMEDNCVSNVLNKKIVGKKNIKIVTPGKLNNLNLKEHNYSKITDVNKNPKARTRKRKSTVPSRENQESPVKKRGIAKCSRMPLHFNCVICEETLPKFEDVIEHFDKTHEGSSRCILCDRFYSSRAKRVLKYHMNTHRPKISRFDCLKCCQYFITKEEMTEHYKSEEHNADPKTCKICNKTFKYRYRALEHIGSHTNERKHQCPICGKFFRFNGGLSKHIKTAHQGFRLLCYLCGKLYTTKVALDNHIKSAHTGEKLFNTIKKKYRRKRKAVMKQTGTKETKCRHCDEECYTVNERKRHESLKHQSFHDYKCPRCCQAFHSSEARIFHVQSVHIKHKCPICGQGFALQNVFNRHVEAHKTGFTKCEVCGLECRSKIHLKIHMNVHTGNRPFKCDKCNMGFRQKPHLNYHQFQHTRKKPFECHLCKKAFGQKCYLDSHMYVHTGERPYACDFCDKAYTEKGTLRKHVKKVHGKLGIATYKTKRFNIDTGS